MPIFKESYHTWEGYLEEKPRTWLVIAKTGIKLAWTKGLIIILILGSIPLIVGAVKLFLFSKVQDVGIMTPSVKKIVQDVQFFSNFLKGQMFYLILVSIFTGAGLIAKDKKHKSFGFYFSKPVSFWDYIAGKFGVTGSYAFLITGLPALILFVIKALISKDSTFISNYYYLIFSILGASILSIFVMSSIVLAFSAISGSVRTAAIYFFTFLILPDIIRKIFSSVSFVGLFSVTALLKQANAYIFNVQVPYEFSCFSMTAALFLIIMLSLCILKLKVRTTEVVT
ncbi:hypothetical protein J7K93_09750 [bacterium]|nr:hypothetical protein [bacterium]